MRIIKVNAIDSTNSFVRQFYEGDPNFEPVCVRALTQTKGRGQRGSNWRSKPGENLTFSILYPQEKLNISRHFLLSAVISMAILEALQVENIPELKVKWPNDILSARFKIGGILIENIVKAEGIVASIIGIGLNVNQVDFDGLPQASSLKVVSKKQFDLDNLLELLLFRIEENLKKLPQLSDAEILKEYERNMFRIGKVSVFEKPGQGRFNGIIKGVTAEGKLSLELEDGVSETFDLKEVRLLY